MKLLLLMLTFNLYAATTVNLQLQGVVPTVLNLIVTPTNNLTLDLSTTQTDLKVADVRSISNSSTGYKITLVSANEGNLSNGSENIAYTAKFDSVSVSLESTPQDIYTGASGIQNDLNDFEISYTGQDFEETEEGTYTDTLTFTIEAN